MTWEPRNRVEDDDVNLDDDDHKSNDDKDLLGRWSFDSFYSKTKNWIAGASWAQSVAQSPDAQDELRQEALLALVCSARNSQFSRFLTDSKDSGTGSSEDGDRPSHIDLLDRSHGPSDWNGSRNGSGPNSPDIMYNDPRTGQPPHPLLHPAHFPHHLRPPMGGAPPDSNHNTTPNPNKPRIWSLADMASKDGGKDDPPTSGPGGYPAGSSPGKMISPLAARGFHSLHHPYMRPDLYRNFYGSAAAHLSDPHNVALLESYQRQLGAMAANGGLPPGFIGKAGGPGGPFVPLSLTTSSHLPHRASSPASSTSSSPRDRDRGDPPPPPSSDKPTALVTTGPKP